MTTLNPPATPDELGRARTAIGLRTFQPDPLYPAILSGIISEADLIAEIQTMRAEAPEPGKEEDPCDHRGISVITYAIGGDAGPVKIGRTNNLAKRLSTLQNGNPVKLRALARWDRDCELELHTQLRPDRGVGEWFARSPEVVMAIQAADHTYGTITPDPDSDQDDIEPTDLFSLPVDHPRPRRR